MREPDLGGQILLARDQPVGELLVVAESGADLGVGNRGDALDRRFQFGFGHRREQARGIWRHALVSHGVPLDHLVAERVPFGTALRAKAQAAADIERRGLSLEDALIVATGAGGIPIR